LKALLHEVLDGVLPKDAHLRLNARAGKVRKGGGREGGREGERERMGIVGR